MVAEGDGRWQASDGNWYPAQDHPDPDHRAAWSTYRPFGATVAPDQLPVIAVQPTAGDQPVRSVRLKWVIVGLVWLMLMVLVFVVVGRRFLG